MGSNQVPAAPIKMLHIFPSFGYGGQQARFAAIAGGLGDRFSHHVVALDDDFSARSLVTYQAHVRYWKFVQKKGSFVSFANLGRYAKLFKDTNPDMLCTYNWGSMEAVIANRLGPRLPHIHFEDGFGSDESSKDQKSRRVWARRAALAQSTVVVPSRDLETVAEAVWKLPAERVSRIENGVDFARFQKTSSHTRRRVAVGAVGALRPEKNFSRLIKAFAAADNSRNATLTIYGAGPERTHLGKVVEMCEVKDRVSLPGPTEAPEESYREFDLFAISSDTEQAPLVLMEAMAAGLPVVAVNVGDIADMVSNENLAFVTPLGDEDAFTLALTHLIQNSDTRMTLGAANRSKAREAFNAKKMIERHRTLYLETVGRDG